MYSQNVTFAYIFTFLPSFMIFEDKKDEYVCEAYLKFNWRFQVVHEILAVKGP